MPIDSQEKLILHIKPVELDSFFRENVYGFVDKNWVRSMFGKTLIGVRCSMNYYKVGEKEIHIYNATSYPV